ncbi:P-II family nitrogen regulator [Salipaludibacillus aurantiacus]|uniref:Nitrogen regulatory protein P-II family n=1 Tax=Salipaludibacillus aurantiacus TaxID=1601833 RepID=A0A1H9WCQ0_9BACI|nr:P-II family nitrogen regulator [Salipaludibacillus aurantiacus]SES31594.1 hypothetical protein SAMN05518684_11620 [Salipaludibacillus aurantiacus]
MSKEYKAIISIVDNNLTDTVLEKIEEEHGITSSTVILARGRSDKDGGFFGFKVEPERECVITLVNEESLKQVIETIETYGELKEPGQGIVFSLSLEHVGGLLPSNMN